MSQMKSGIVLDEEYDTEKEQEKQALRDSNQSYVIKR